MAITVEDGTGVTGANSYASVAALDAYAVHRLSLTAYNTAAKESALVIASMDWVDGQHTFRGESLTDTQGLFFPTEDDDLPADIVTATLKAALLQLQGLLLVDLTSISTSGEVESESKSVGSLSKSTTYRSGSSQRYSRILPRDLTSLLWPYLLANGMGVTYRL
jgi:hypothetical protein